MWHFLDENEQCASWPSSPERAAASSAAGCSGGAPSALLRLMPTAATSCSPDSKTGTSDDSQSGTTCAPSTETHGGGGVDVVSGGFPCQDISASGSGAGLDGARSGLWFEMARIIREVRPRYAFVENSPMLTLRGLDRVLADLAEMGFDAEWGVLGAADVGAPHQRDRIWIVAHANNEGHRHLAEHAEVACPSTVDGQAPNAKGKRRGQGGPRRPVAGDTRESEPERSLQVPDANGAGLEGREHAEAARAALAESARGGWWASEFGLARLAHGMADRVERTRATGNGQVPGVVRLAWETLK